MIVLIDNGHGVSTGGKRSPDGTLLEYKFNRVIAAGIRKELQARGYDARLVVPEETDISLKARCARVNEYCKKYGKDNVILVSIHGNAAGNGKWMTAQGWSAYTTKGITKADRLAWYLYEAADKCFPGRKIRRFNGKDNPDWEENFYILLHSYCPAVLTENFFQDNRDDCAFMKSPTGQSAIIMCHVHGIINYIKSL